VRSRPSLRRATLRFALSYAHRVSYREIRLDPSAPIAQLWLARPEARNAMTEAMGTEVERAVQEINAAPGVRVLVVRGEGKSFSAGGDFQMLEERAGANEVENRAAMQRFYRSFLAVRAVRVPTIAVLHGAAMGAGLCFAMACDLRIAAVGTKLGFNFVRVGLHPGMGATWLLPRLIGPSRATELLLTGRTLEAEEAVAMGLIHRVHSASALDAASRALADEIVSAAPVAVAQTKATLLGALDRTLDESLAEEAGAQAVDFGTQDLKEAIAAFTEKRKPGFSGR
jgi:enoyl-CoA hydratase/carnithine racemase